MTALLSPPATAPHDVAHVRRRRLLRERAGLLVLLAGTATAYLWSLASSGYANSFYAAAAQAGSQSWKAWLFGSLDASNAVTVDKPPASLWVMGLSVRIFGLSSWSILVPEALMGVATVALVWATVRRAASARAALIAGAVTALTPSAALMFRFDNPDALLLLLLVGAGYATLRAAETARGRWLMLAGSLIGLAFLTKMLQAFLVLPAFALVYLVVAPTTLRRRLLHLVGAGVALVLSAGWWIAIAELWPASSRPYFDGTTDNNILELVIGYNGLGRITGDETGGLGNAGFSSGVGVLRLFEGVSGGMVAWLLPAALIGLVGGLVALRKAPRTDLTRALLMLAGGTTVVTGLVFSFMAGIYHDYYTVALAPWIAITAVTGGVALWRVRQQLVARVVLAISVAVSAVWAFALLGQSGEQPYDALRWLVLPLGLGLAGAFLAADRLARTVAAGLLVATAVTLNIGPAAYAVDTIATAHTGSIVTAGPYSARGGFGFGGGPGGRGGFGGPGGAGQQGGQPQLSAPGTGAAPTGGQTGGPGGGFGGGMGGGMGGMIDGATVDADLVTALQTDAGQYTWVAATVGSQSAAGYQLASGGAVMAIGGFNGTAPSTTLAQFEAEVAAGKIHYFIPGGGMGGGMGGQSGTSSVASQITSWVEQHFSSTTIGSTTVYDLTASTTSGAAS
jgi:4-amino-4-deoxy-L-arabinose transferase-like glycosyltransferase